MNLRLLLIFLFVAGGLVSAPLRGQAQGQTQAQAQAQTQTQASGRRGQTYWYAVQNKAVVWKSGPTTKTLRGEISLPNGSRLRPASCEVVLAGGEVETLGPDDLVMPSGSIIRLKAPTNLTASTEPGGAAPETVLAYVPAAPVGGRLQGVVQLGASGFDSFIIRADARHNWKLERAEYGVSLVLENLATEDDIRRGLKGYIAKMLDYGVAGRDIHFVVSSGAAAATGTQVITASLRHLGYQVNVVSAEQEAVLGLRATLPQPYAERAFVVDLGSANTKLAWLADGRPVAAETYGAKYFQQQVPDSLVRAGVVAQATKVPANRRQTCFIIGGVPFELAKIGRQGKEPYTLLLGPNEYKQLEGAKIRSGLVIYQALAAATGCQRFIFSWDANFAIGYLLGRP